MNGITKRPGAGLLAVALVAALGAALAASAQPYGAGGRAAGAGPMVRALRGGLSTLDLTDDQKAKIRTLLESKRDAAEALALTTRTDAKALRDLAAASSPDAAAVGAAFLKVKADREAVRAAAQGALGEVKAVLTPDQAAKLDGYLAAHRQMRHGRGGGF
jgi:Spy/CpxP family protein refolding chaperone